MEEISYSIEELTDQSVASLAALFLTMWPDSTLEKERQDCEFILGASDQTAFLVRHLDKYVGFIYLSTRHDFVEGANKSPVGYIEGIFILPEYRRQSIGRALMEKGKEWAKSMGYTQLGSDTEWDNQRSADFHHANGFRTVSKVVCFMQDL